jgi:yeast amino acid transporter
LGGIIGVGFFRGSSSTTALAGPGGAMIAVFVVGIIVIAVMEGICELINIWPIPNAMVEFVRSFVDEDLGIAVGILYW